MTHIAKIRAQFSANRLAVLWLTGMTDEQLSQFQFDLGIEWLQAYTGDDEVTLSAIMMEPLIWQWWKNEWNRRDHYSYLPALYRLTGHVKRDEVMARYRMMHQEIFIRWTPPYTLLENAYSIAIGQTVKKQPHHD